MGELKVIESGIVPVYQTDTGEKIVYGTELHKTLEVKTDFSTWVKRRLDECDAKENKDYQTCSSNFGSESRGGQNKKEYIIQLATAKEMAMLERNDKGKQVRRYFISVEEKYKEAVAYGHNVKQLTINSREVAKIAGKLHSWVLQGIRERIADLQEIGFDTRELYTETSYTTKANCTAPQFLCTERGCEDFSRCLEPDARKVFLSEFADRFERMRNVLDGKPVKKADKAIHEGVPGQEPEIKIFQSSSNDFLLMDSEIYSLKPCGAETVQRFIAELQENDVGKIRIVLRAFIKSFAESSKLKEVASWGVKQEEPQAALLPDKTAQKQKRTSSKDYNAPFITVKQAENRYNMGHTNIEKVAKESGAWIKYGNAVRIDTVKIDEHLRKEYAE